MNGEVIVFMCSICCSLTSQTQCMQSIKKNITLAMPFCFKSLHWETCHANMWDILYLFIEGKQQGSKPNNETRNKTCEDDILSLIDCEGRTEIEECCSFVIQKQLLLYIIHFTLILLLRFALYYPQHYHSEYAKAFNNLAHQCLFFHAIAKN